MNAFKEKLLQFLREEDGLETVEYAVAGSLIVAGSIAAFTNLGTEVSQAIDCIATTIDTGVDAC